MTRLPLLLLLAACCVDRPEKAPPLRDAGFGRANILKPQLDYFARRIDDPTTLCDPRFSEVTTAPEDGGRPGMHTVTCVSRHLYCSNGGTFRIEKRDGGFDDWWWVCDARGRPNPDGGR